LDTALTKHQITEKIASDSQGALFATRNPDIIIRERGSFESAKTLPLAGIRNLLIPMQQLDSGGYALCIPEGVAAVPLGNLNYPACDDFIKSGGLTRRLGILANIARCLMELHSLALIYGTLTAERVFVSAKPTSTDACLLYSSEITYANDAAEIESDSQSFWRLAYDILTFGETQNTLSPEMREFFKTENPRLADFCKMVIA